jgi:SHS family lactate transporter-like MFS transporter
MEGAVMYAHSPQRTPCPYRKPWGVIPVHLNELSPDTARGTFPGFVYQLGNLLASVNATLQAGIATHYGGNYGIALAAVAGTVAIVICVLTVLGTEARGVAFGQAKEPLSAA